MKLPVATYGLRPATQVRLLLRWVAIAVLAALIAVAYYFFFAAPAAV